MPSVFVSYSRVDRELLAQLGASLPSELALIRDVDILGHDTPMVGTLLGAIERAAYFVVLLTPGSADSGWVQYEVQHRLAACGIEGGLVLDLRGEGGPLPSWFERPWPTVVAPASLAQLPRWVRPASGGARGELGCRVGRTDGVLVPAIVSGRWSRQGSELRVLGTWDGDTSYEPELIGEERREGTDLQERDSLGSLRPGLDAYHGNGWIVLYHYCARANCRPLWLERTDADVAQGDIVAILRPLGVVPRDDRPWRELVEVTALSSQSNLLPATREPLVDGLETGALDRAEGAPSVAQPRRRSPGRRER